MAALIRFPANDIPIDGLVFDAELSTAWLDEQLEDVAKASRGDGEGGRLAGRLSRSGQDVVVRGHLTASIEVPCVRCLDPARIDVDTDLSLLLQPASRAELRKKGRHDEDDRDFTAGEADLDMYDGETVILDTFVRDAILLEVPSFPLCRDDCPGLDHPSAEAQPEAPVDPRFAPLGAFRKHTDGPITIHDLAAAAAERSTALGRKPVLRSNQASPNRKKRNKK